MGSGVGSNTISYGISFLCCSCSSVFNRMFHVKNREVPVSSGKPSVRQHLRENKEAIERMHSFLNHFMEGYNQVEKVVDILYELNMDEVNKIIEGRIKEGGDDG